MEKRNGSVRSALRGMPFNQIGKPIPRPVARENTDVIVVPSSQGNQQSLVFSLFFFFSLPLINLVIEAYIYNVWEKERHAKMGFFGFLVLRFLE